jgi:hypothetical protein
MTLMNLKALFGRIANVAKIQAKSFSAGQYSRS